MKKIAPILLLAIFLGGCSGLDPILSLITSPTPGIPTETRTPQPTVTLIPTRDLFATTTPTPVTNTPTETPLVPDQLPTQTRLSSLTPPPVSTSNIEFYTPQSQGFVAVLNSNYVLYYNTGACSPRSLTITAFVQDLVHTDTVLLFMRLREKSDTMLLGEWSAGEMLENDNGSYSYQVTAVKLRKYYWFRDAWLEYQLVTYDKNRVELARTQIYNRNISLVMCRTFSP
ncbi:MAG TPA: hypothetical protein VMJ90_05315 [Anaerolineales bacterium]|nr:hypothetical protein [Anaerolineales bacterium]